MKVFTYYVPIAGKPEDDELALIDVWKKSWSRCGWEPVVLDQSHLPDDPEARRLLRAFRKQPTRLRPGMAYASFARWLAVAEQGGGFMCDYDVINYSFTPLPVGEITVFERHVPCLVSGTPEEFMRICRLFADYRADAADRVGWWKCTSDMKVLIRRPEAYLQRRDCAEYFLPGWETAAAVHFSNFAMKPRGQMPRHSRIEALRPFS